MSDTSREPVFGFQKQTELRLQLNMVKRVLKDRETIPLKQLAQA
jgi:hypothetical protein